MQFGPIMAAACRAYGIKSAVIALEFTIAGLVEAIGDFFEEGSK